MAHIYTIIVSFTIILNGFGSELDTRISNNLANA